MTACVVSPKGTKESAQFLAASLDIDWKLTGMEDFSKYDHVINYGSRLPFTYKNVINPPEAVKICVNKLSTLKRLHEECNTVEYTKDKEQARLWFTEDGVVISRALQESKQGRGVTLCESLKQFEAAEAKFWTRYCHHTNEVRINVFRGKVLSIYDKRIEGGFFDFVNLKITGEHPDVTKMVTTISKNIGIDYYGMDVLVDHSNTCHLLEINSGPILHKETLKPLVRALKGAMNG